jgi:hypothetical protein
MYAIGKRENRTNLPIQDAFATFAHGRVHFARLFTIKMPEEL